MQVRFYADLRGLVGGATVNVPDEQAGTAGAALRHLAAAYPALREKLWNREGAWAGYVTVLINGRHIQYLQGLDTPLGPTDQLSIFPPIGGGL